ncbi:MAG: hypothetical protein IT318_21935 [Anaerolineales bacterium]|nr:hypothetical protein [Anaerolineales bacterium]
MAPQPKPIRTLRVADLLIDLENPRYDVISSQRESLATIAREQGAKLANLAEDIAVEGLNPSELLIVSETANPTQFIVLEGNRRIAAIKIASSPTLAQDLGLPPTLSKRYRAIYDRYGDSMPEEVPCAVLTREDSRNWIRLKHTGENDGVGIVNWDGRAKQRFRGSSPALQAIELVENSTYLDRATRAKLPEIAITNIERLFTTPEARQLIGVEVKNSQLFLTSPESEALGRLAIVVDDVANRRIRVSDLDSRQQRIDYAQDVASRKLPEAGGATVPGTSGGGAVSAPESGATKVIRRYKPDRANLIPRQFRLAIPQARINRIYYELQRLDLERFVNSAAVLFRVFLELSLDDYAKRKRIKLKVARKPRSSAPLPTERDMTLREKLDTVASYLETKGFCEKTELRGIRSLVANRNHVLSVDSLNAYVHNKDYSPTVSDLRTTWDNIEVFVGRLWSM